MKVDRFTGAMLYTEMDTSLGDVFFTNTVSPQWSRLATRSTNVGLFVHGSLLKNETPPGAPLLARGVVSHVDLQGKVRDEKKLSQNPGSSARGDLRSEIWVADLPLECTVLPEYI